MTAISEGRAGEWLQAGGHFDWSPSGGSASAGSLRIFHAELGDPDAPVLLLVHGFPTSSVDWFEIATSLSREYRVCALDFPGFGFSDKPREGGYTIGRDCELVEHYLGEVVGASAASVIAHDR